VPEANQYTFTHKELAELMIKKLGIHEGRWMVSFTFSFGVMNGGPSPDQIVPTGVVGVQTVGIMRAQPESPEILVVDAAVVNPASSEPSRPSKRSRGASSETA
jgi:hypothetical protein